MHELGASQYSIPDTSVAAEPTAEPTVPLQSIEWVEGYPRLVGGRKRALLIGIHYTGQAGELRGCHADVEAVREFLTSRYGFTAEEMLVLTDDPANAVCEYLWPSKRAILAAMMWLVDGAQPGDSLFLHFSGHGGQQQDTDGDEDDGYDETIYPVDHATAGMIVDDEMNAILVHPLPAGARLTALFDSCHSGTALDLQVVYKADGRVEKRKGKANRILTAAADAAREAFHGAGPGVLMRGAVEMFKEAMAPEKSAMTLARVQREKGSQGTVVMFAGCKDSQKSVDVEIAGRATGAMSFALLATLRARGGQSYAQVLASTRDTLRKGYSQVPQLSAAAAIDIHQLFVL
ncbi:calcium-dependent metacaspase CDP II [Blastocladiella britannica]|nr:calcium-dependent metacaspase CDP II [Blastocladiella britannica]